MPFSRGFVTSSTLCLFTNSLLCFFELVNGWQNMNIISNVIIYFHCVKFISCSGLSPLFVWVSSYKCCGVTFFERRSPFLILSFFCFLNVLTDIPWYLNERRRYYYFFLARCYGYMYYGLLSPGLELQDCDLRRFGISSIHITSLCIFIDSYWYLLIEFFS